MVEIEINGTVYTCTMHDRFRPHSREERAYFIETIGGSPELGVKGFVRTAIRLYYDTTLDKDNCVLDGQGRLTTVKLLGLTDFPKYHHGRMTTEDAYAEAKILNDCRRHEVDRGQIESRRHEVATLRAKGMSMRQIAKEVGTSLSTVRDDVNALRAAGGEPDPDVVVGSNGKSYSPTAPEQEQEEEVADMSGDHPEDEDVETFSLDDPDDGPPEPAVPTPAYDARADLPPAAPAWMKPGDHSDPDHPFHEILQAATRLTTLLTKALASASGEDADANSERLLRYLLAVQQNKPVIGNLVLPRRKIEGDKHLKDQFIGLRGLRRIIKLAGESTARKDKTILKEFTDPEGDD